MHGGVESVRVVRGGGGGGGVLQKTPLEACLHPYIAPEVPANVRAVVWCGVVWCGVVWCGVVWCGVVCDA